MPKQTDDWWPIDEDMPSFCHFYGMNPDEYRELDREDYVRLKNWMTEVLSKRKPDAS